MYAVAFCQKNQLQLILLSKMDKESVVTEFCLYNKRNGFQFSFIARSVMPREDAIIERPMYLERIRPFMGKHVIKVLVGVRRSGKSTILDMVHRRLLADAVPEERILHLRFDSSKLMNVRDARSFSELVNSWAQGKEDGRLCFLLDEIQEVEGWEQAVNALTVDYDADIYVTGSNAHLLSSDLATYITGRYVTFEVHPFAFAEYVKAIRAAGGALAGEDNRALFHRYVMQGGFPFQIELGFERDATMHYLEDILSTILFKDVVRRNSIRDVDLLERIVRYAVAEEGHLLTPKSVADYFKAERRKVAQETVANYLHAAVGAYLLYRARREDAVGKRELKFNEKYYVVDQGLRAVLGRDNTASIDQVLEGIVFMELRRRGYDVTVGVVGDREIDFLARKGAQLEYYQVAAYVYGGERTAEREFGSLERLSDNYPKFVLSLDDFPQSRDGIMGFNLVDWLLSPNYPVPSNAGASYA